MKEACQLRGKAVFDFAADNRRGMKTLSWFGSIFIFFLLSVCVVNANTIVGEWELTRGNKSKAYIKINADGTCLVNEKGLEASCTWEDNNKDSITMDIDGKVIIARVTVNDELEITKKGKKRSTLLTRR